LAGVDAVGIADGWIRVQQARRVGGVAELRLGNLGEGVAGAYGVLRGGAARGAGRRQNNLRAGDDAIRIGDQGIGGEQFPPAETFAKILLGEFPERVAALHGHYISSRGVRRSGWRGRLNGREGNGGRTRRSDERRRGYKSSWAAEWRALHRWLIGSEARRGRFGRWSDQVQRWRDWFRRWSEQRLHRRFR
jgi:hypothetical protein